MRIHRSKTMTTLTAAMLLAGCASEAGDDSPEEQDVSMSARQALDTACITVQRTASGGVADATLWQSAPNWNDSSGPRISTGTSATGGLRKSVLRYDLSGIPAGAQILSAIVSLEQLYRSGAASTVDVMRVTAPWSERDVTWNSLGDSFDPAPVASFAAGNGASVTQTIDIRHLAQDWIDGALPNHGLLLAERLPVTATDYRSSESPNLSQRPRLDICFNACNGATPVACTALDSCHVAGTCDPSTGACSNPAAPDGTACSLPNAGAECHAGTCTVVACAAGLGDCDGLADNGCEHDVGGDAENCGACGNACAPGEVCEEGACTSPLRFNGETGTSWEIRSSVPVTTPGFSDYTPAGQNAFFSLRGADLHRYDMLADSWTRLPSPPIYTSSWAGMAWIDDALYAIQGGAVLRYGITANSWTTLVRGLPSTAWSLTTHDDAGRLYAMATDTRLVQFDLNTNAVRLYATGRPLASQPRLAFDPVTGLLFVVANFCSNSDFYAFNPEDGSMTMMPALPVPGCFNDPFCSDRSGHLYAVGAPDGTGRVWQYSTVTRTWREIPSLPFSHGFNGACNVTDDGWLYITPGDDTRMARIRLF